MPRDIHLKAAGLYTDPNPLDGLPEGALVEARNVVIRRPGLIEPRPGWGKSDFDLSSGDADGYAVIGAFPWRDSNGSTRTLALYSAGGSKLYRPENPADISGGPTAFAFGKTHAAEAGGSLFVTSEDGVYRIDESTALTASLSGLPRPNTPLLADTVPVSSLRWFLAGNTVAYRVTFVRTLANGRRVESAPSGRSTITNSSTDRAVNLTIKTPSSIVEGDRIRVYRSEQSPTGTPTDEMFLVFEYEMSALDVSFGGAGLPDYTLDNNRGLALYTNAGQQGALQESTTPPYAADVALYSGMLIYGRARGKHRIATQIRSIDPDDSSAVFVSAGANMTFVVDSDIVTVNSGLEVHDGLIGCYVWDMSTGDPEGITGGPPSLVPSGTTIIAVDTGAGTFQMSEVALGNDTGTSVLISAWLQVEGEPRVYAGPFESIVGRMFRANVSPPDTAESLARVLGDISDDVDPVNASSEFTGAIVFESKENDVSFTIDTHNASAWSLSLSDAISSELGGGDGYIAISKLDEPDHVPFPSNYLSIGKTSEPVLRVIPTDDACLVFKRDGIFRVSGFTPATLRVDVLSRTAVLVHPDAAGLYGGDVWALTNAGLMIVSASGLRKVSGPVDNDLGAIAEMLLVEDFTDHMCFLVGHEVKNEVYLGVKTDSADIHVTVVYVFNTRTGAITTWDVPNYVFSGAFDPNDGHLVLGGTDDAFDGALYTDRLDVGGERRTWDAATAATIGSLTELSPTETEATITYAAGEAIAVGDVVEAGGVRAIVTSIVSQDVTSATFRCSPLGPLGTGATTVRHAYDCVVAWAESVVGDPGVSKHFREALLHFERLNTCRTLSLSYSTEVTPAEESVAITQTYADDDTTPRVFRSFVTRNHSRAMRLRPKLTITQAMADWRLSALQLTYEPMSTMPLRRSY